MKRRIKELLRLSFSSPHSKIHHQPLSRSLQPTSSSQCSTSFSTFSKSQRDSLIFQQFKERKLKGSSKDSIFNPRVSNSVPESFDTNVEKTVQKGLKNESENEDSMVVANFKELGLSEVLVEVMEEIGDFLPTEIQCVVIPTILEGKSLLLSSPSQPDRTLAYLLPLIQLLRRDSELHGSNSKHPRAVVLCASEEKVEQCFNAARYIIHNAELKSAKNRASSDNKKSNSSIGLMIGTPCEILQYIDEGIVVLAELKYLVLDEADSMLGNHLGPEIHKIIRPLQNHDSKSDVKRLQTILAISTIAEVLGEKSPIVERLERDHAGNVSALSIEMEEAEVFHLTKSLDALRKKLEEAMNSL
ncbi:DEAD-box ATP-dependent RNA helicase 39-like [Vicia villosa]|uniref:DEAD-box ATP-dependent RNA helicase 39-like n=1 Tax=Vicia villosa TaxID=3911 RepID=UPI00273BF594|nr:DEAD-box ATP-dependent RNA helicase 39-like [Vicia villosa]